MAGMISTCYAGVLWRVRPGTRAFSQDASETRRCAFCAAVAFVATTTWIARAQWIPALVGSRNVLGLAKTIAAAMGCFSAIWLSVTRLVMEKSRSLFDFGLCLTVAITFVSAFTAAFLNKTASSATPKAVCVAWWALLCAMMPRITIRAEVCTPAAHVHPRLWCLSMACCVFRAQEEGTTEDNCIRTMFVAAACLSCLYLIPKTDIPRDYERSIMTSPICAKLAVDALRVCSEVWRILVNSILLPAVTSLAPLPGVSHRAHHR